MKARASITTMICLGMLLAGSVQVAAAQSNSNASVQVGQVNINRTSQCGDTNTNSTYQEGRVNINQTNQRACVQPERGGRGRPQGQGAPGHARPSHAVADPR